ALVRGLAGSNLARPRTGPTACSRLASATATDTNSTVITSRRSWRRGCGLPGARPAAPTWETVRGPRILGFLGFSFPREFKPNPLAPHPLFAAFVGAAYERRHRSLTAPVESPEAAAVDAARKP